MNAERPIVNDVLGRFRGFGFAVVGEWGGAGADKLTGDVLGRKDEF